MEPRVTIRMIRQRLEAQMLHGARSFWRSSTSIDGRWLLFQSVLRETRFIASASSVCVCVCVWFLFPLEKNSATFTAFWWLGSVHLNLLAPLTMFEKKKLKSIPSLPIHCKSVGESFRFIGINSKRFLFHRHGVRTSAWIMLESFEIADQNIEMALLPSDDDDCGDDVFMETDEKMNDDAGEKKRTQHLPVPLKFIKKPDVSNQFASRFFRRRHCHPFVHRFLRNFLSNSHRSVATLSRRRKVSFFFRKKNLFRWFFVLYFALSETGVWDWKFRWWTIWFRFQVRRGFAGVACHARNICFPPPDYQNKKKKKLYINK